jgi:hypothetical protein
VRALAETVKSMDLTLQGRRKAAPGSASKGGEGMSDSEKISLQVHLDVVQYRRDMDGVLAVLCPGYTFSAEEAARLLPLTTALVAEVAR